MKNRIYKFRAWHGDSRNMCQVRSFDFISGFIDILSVRYPSKDGWGKAFNRAHKDEFVLMQYTGIKDKNGQEIYEGDIVKRSFGKHGNTKTVVVEFNKGQFFPIRLSEPMWEVVGNIYENPELLEKE